jgi:hypothetical protein
MRAYGVKRTWSSVEDCLKGGHAESPKSHSNTKRIYHRIARRVTRYKMKLLIRTGIDSQEITNEQAKSF